MDSLEYQLLASFSGSLFNSSRVWDSHLVIPSLCLLVLLSLVFKLSFMLLFFFLIHFDFFVLLCIKRIYLYRFFLFKKKKEEKKKEEEDFKFYFYMSVWTFL